MKSITRTEIAFFPTVNKVDKILFKKMLLLIFAKYHGNIRTTIIIIMLTAGQNLMRILIINAIMCMPESFPKPDDGIVAALRVE